MSERPYDHAVHDPKRPGGALSGPAGSPDTAGRRVGPSPAAFVLATLAGIAFAVFPLIRPWGDKAGGSEEMAQAFADPLWVYSHLSGMIGWVLLAAAASAARNVTARAAWPLALGVAAVLPYYGAETFALHVLADASLDRGDASLVEMESLIRAEPVATILFGLGLLMAAVGAVLLAADTWRLGRVRWAGIPLALLVGLYLPQFFAPEAARMTHGLLLGIACVLWGAAAARR